MTKPIRPSEASTQIEERKCGVGIAMGKGKWANMPAGPLAPIMRPRGVNRSWAQPEDDLPLLARIPDALSAWCFFTTSSCDLESYFFSLPSGFSGDSPGKVRVHLALPWVIVVLVGPVLGAAWMLTAVLEQTGTVLVPAPRLRAVASTKVHVPFPAEFTHLPRVLVTPLTRSPGPLVTPQLCTTTLNVTMRGFDLLVERYDERFPWLGMTVLASWIAWDSTWTPEGQGGSVALVPPQKGSTSNVIEFLEPFDDGPPGVVVTARLEPDATPIVLAVSLQQVTQTYAIVNAFALGAVSKQGQPWTGLVHVDWRAWPVSKDVAVLHNYEVNYAQLDSEHATIHLGKRYDNPPLIVGTVLNAPDQSSAGTTQSDTFLVTVLNITNISFEVNVAKVSDTSAWKHGVELAWVAQNSTKACPDDCLGHGICVGQHMCECDEGWTGNGTCATCADGHWGEECQSCIGYNSSSEAPLESVCSGHGACDGSGSTVGTGQCICEAAYAGGSCELCAEGSHRDLSNGECYICPKANNITCTGHGACEVSHNSSSEQGVCICNGTWAGPYCSVCQRGYAGSLCEASCVGLCNGRGDCFVDDLTGDLACQCDRGWSDAAHCGTCGEGYYGTACENACRDCGPHGSCDDGFAGSGNCTCEPGYEAQQDCLACSWGYYHEAGADDLDFMCRECPGSAQNPCSGRGQPLGRCDGGRCICIAGYVGESCEHVSPTRFWALVLIIFLATIIFVGLSVLALSTWWKMRRLKTFRSQSNREIDRELRKRLLEQCPELKGLEDALSALGSDPADWLIQYERLELGAKIGSGTSSVVFRGLYSDELVAIKRLHGGRCDPSTSAAFFRQEAELLCKLHHPHVVRFYGVCYQERDFYIVTEFCKDTLQQVLTTRRRNGTKLPVEELLRIATQVASGMAYLHSRHIVHRDLKPENVLLDDRGIVKLCDFGLSKLVVNDSQMTMQVGSPAYMSPEMADGSGMSESVDVYSFGILLWALWSCQNPYNDLDITPVQLLSRVVQGLRPQMDSDMLRPLAQLMRTCWAADPTQRPTFERLVTDLRDLHREQIRRSETTTRSTIWSESALEEEELTEEQEGEPLVSTV